MKLYTIAIAAVVGTNAFTIDDVKDAVQNVDVEPLTNDLDDILGDVKADLDSKHGNFFDDIKDKIMDSDAYHQVDDWWQNFEPTTVHDSHEWAKNHLKKFEDRSTHQLAITRQAHHRVNSMREASGRPPLMGVHQIHNLSSKDQETRLAATTQWLEYDGIDNFANTLYSFTTGFIYTPGQQSDCSNSILVYFSAWVNSIDILKKIYLPYNWPNFQVVLQDIIATGSDTMFSCDVNKLFNTLSHLFTAEGATELGARVAGAAPFELLQVMNVLGDKEATGGEKAKQVGKLCATILNYHI